MAEAWQYLEFRIDGDWLIDDIRGITIDHVPLIAPPITDYPLGSITLPIAALAPGATITASATWPRQITTVRAIGSQITT